MTLTTSARAAAASANGAAWLTAWATVGLLVAAVIAAIFAFLAYRKQSREVRLLQTQFDEDAQQRRRQQAAQIFVWVDASDLPRAPSACVMNTSKQPVYDLSLELPGGGRGRSPAHARYAVGDSRPRIQRYRRHVHGRVQIPRRGGRAVAHDG